MLYLEVVRFWVLLQGALNGKRKQGQICGGMPSDDVTTGIVVQRGQTIFGSRRDSKGDAQGARKLRIPLDDLFFGTGECVYVFALHAEECMKCTHPRSQPVD